MSYAEKSPVPHAYHRAQRMPVAEQEPSSRVGAQPATDLTPRELAQRQRLHAAFGPAAQLRKSTAPPHEALNNGKLRQRDSGTAGSEGSPEERRQDIWSHLLGVYNGCLAKGRVYWAKVEQRTDQYINDKPRLERELEAIRASYDERYHAHYRTTVKANGAVSTSGHVDNTAPLEGEGTAYSNQMDTARGRITASSNYAGRDAARLADTEAHAARTPDYKTRGLPNSEVLWRQYFAAARDRFWVMKDSRAQAAMRELSGIQRQNIVNVVTLQAAYMALPDGLDFTTAHTWRPGNDDFLAVIGTPNCAPAAHMVADHIDEMGGKTISYILSTGEANAQFAGTCMDIEFEPLPEVRAAEEAEADLEAGVHALALFVALSLGGAVPD